MTDKYGSDADQHHLGEHGDENHESQEWHDEGAPVDDFADHGTHHGHEDHADAASATEEAEPVEDNVVESGPTKRSLPLLPMMAGIGLLLILGAGLYYQFGGSKSSANPQIARNTAPPLQLDNSQPVTPMPTPQPATAPTLPTAPTSADTTVPAQVTPTSAAVLQPAVMPAVTPTAIPAVMPAPVMAAPSTASASVTPAVDGRLTTLSTKVDDLQKSLDQATQKLTQVSGMLANQAAANAPSPAVDDRLTKIEQQLAQIENHTHKSSASPASRQTVENTTSTIAAMPKPIEPILGVTPAKKIRHSHAHSAAKPRRAHKPASIDAGTLVSSPGVTMTTVNATMPAASNENWVLRAATPTEAWVAKNNVTSDLHHVQVGDNLAGIGQVRAIRQNGNGWAIEGSQGSIR